jgi:hypothetical protein
MFKNVLVRKVDSLAAFLLNYQIYEQMIHLSFERKLIEFKNAISSFSGTSSDLKDTLKEVNHINDELAKLKDYVATLDFSAATLNECGKRFQHVHGDHRKEDFATSLYAARNKILHNYRNLSTASIEAINILNLELFELTPKLICAEILPPRTAAETNQVASRSSNVAATNPAVPLMQGDVAIGASEAEPILLPAELTPLGKAIEKPRLGILRRIRALGMSFRKETPKGQKV